jgi:hypothetical protein
VRAGPRRNGTTEEAALLMLAQKTISTEHFQETLAAQSDRHGAVLASIEAKAKVSTARLCNLEACPALELPWEPVLYSRRHGSRK